MTFTVFGVTASNLDAIENKARADAERLYGKHGDPSKHGSWIGHLDYALMVIDLVTELRSVRNDLSRLSAILNTPGTEDFMRDVETEAAHQIDRWGSAHDASKTDADWFWLIGYLAGKALHDVRGKRTHHIIATAATLLNWHRAVIGYSNHVRPVANPTSLPQEP